MSILVVLLMVVVICFGNVPFLLFVEIRESPEFHDLMREDKVHWPRCLLLTWLASFALWSGANRSSPWAADASEGACYMVEVTLGRFSSDLGSWVGSL